MKTIKIIILALLLVTNSHAITPFYEISPQADHRIAAIALSENGVCWVETVTAQQLRLDKWLDQISPLQIKAIEYHQNGDINERLLWQNNAAIGNTIYDVQTGAGYLQLTYTNLELIPRTQTITIALRNQQWVVTNRPQQALQTLSLSYQDNGEITLPSPSPLVKKSFRLIRDKQLEIAISANIGPNKVRFALPLPQVFSTQVLKSLKARASANRKILVWGDDKQKIVLSMPTFNRVLLNGLENYIDELSYQKDAINQIKAVKFFNLMTLWRNHERLEIDRFLATKAEQLKNTLLALPIPDLQFTLLFSAWDNFARVIPQKTHLQIIGKSQVLELPNQKTVYYIKGTLADFMPTSQEQEKMRAWMARHVSSTAQLIKGIPPASTVGFRYLPDSLASLEITTLHVNGEHIILVASLDSREAKIFEHFLAQGMTLEMRLNTDILGFEIKTKHTLPLSLQINPDAMRAVLIDQDYPIKIDVSDTLFQRAQAIEINYQGRIKTIPLSIGTTSYTIRYALKRDRQHDPIYRFQWRIKFVEQTTPWQQSDFPYVLIDNPL
jgi:hypothetical protein